MTSLLFFSIYLAAALFLVVFGSVTFLSFYRMVSSKVQRVGVAVAAIQLIAGSISVLLDQEWIALPMVIGGAGFIGSGAMWLMNRRESNTPLSFPTLSLVMSKGFRRGD